jgi:hypothetical protein
MLRNKQDDANLSRWTKSCLEIYTGALFWTHVGSPWEQTFVSHKGYKVAWKSLGWRMLLGPCTSVWLLCDPRRIPRSECQSRLPLLPPQTASVMVTLITVCCLYLLLIGQLVSLLPLSQLAEVQCHKPQTPHYRTFAKYITNEGNTVITAYFVCYLTSPYQLLKVYKLSNVWWLHS